MISYPLKKCGIFHEGGRGKLIVFTTMEIIMIYSLGQQFLTNSNRQSNIIEDKESKNIYLHAIVNTIMG